jgi:SnoaL-like domain
LVQPKDEGAAVLQLLDDYGDALDRRRWNSLADLFLVDATADWQLVVHRSHSGRDEIVEFVRSSFDRFARTHHTMSNYMVTVAGDTASASCKARNYHALADPALNQYLETLGEFRIEAVRTTDGWRIAHIELEAFDVVYGIRDQRAGAASET